MITNEQIEHIAEILNSNPQDTAELCHGRIASYKNADDERKLSMSQSLAYELSRLTFNVPIMFDNSLTITRSRKVKNRYCVFDKSSGLSYPKNTASTPIGRANRENSKIFYGSTDVNTSIEEVRSTYGLARNDCINTSKFICNAGSSGLLCVIGQIDHIRRHGTNMIGSPDFISVINAIKSRLRSDVLTAVELVDAFFADEFIKERHEYDDKNIRYRLTSEVSANLMDGDTVDGIIYPSVAHRGGFNIAMKTDRLDEKFTLVSAEAFRLHAYYGYGIFSYETYAETIRIEDDGTVIWRNTAPYAGALMMIPDSGTC